MGITSEETFLMQFQPLCDKFYHEIKCAIKKIQKMLGKKDKVDRKKVGAGANLHFLNFFKWRNSSLLLNAPAHGVARLAQIVFELKLAINDRTLMVKCS